MLLTAELSIHHILDNSMHQYSTNATSQLPDNFKDFVTMNTGDKYPSNAFFVYCHHNLFHEQWKVLLNDKFIDTYEHGIVVICCDGIKQCFYS